MPRPSSAWTPAPARQAGTSRSAATCKAACSRSTSRTRTGSWVRSFPLFGPTCRSAGLDWSVSRGLRMRGSSALELKLPTHLALGPIGIETLTLSVGVSPGAFPISFSADIKWLARRDRRGRGRDRRHRADQLPAERARDDRSSRYRVRVQAAQRRRAVSSTRASSRAAAILHFDPADGEYFGALELSFQGFIDSRRSASSTRSSPTVTRASRSSS